MNSTALILRPEEVSKMKINMNSQEFKLYVIYDFTEDSEKISVQNATKAAEEYVEAYFPYYDANSDESPSDRKSVV